MEEQNNNQYSDNNTNNVQNQGNTNGGTSKVGIGVLCGFIGLIGLIIGLLLYKDGSLERKTFLKGWLWCFFVSLAVYVVIVIILYATVLSAAASLMFIC